jgi:hypothetical protein
MKFKLAIGDKIYSTWSLRPWLVLKYFNIPFDELKIKLRNKDTKKKNIKNFTFRKGSLFNLRENKNMGLFVNL